MDRGNVLVTYLAIVAGAVISLYSGLVLTHQLDSAYGQSVGALASVLGVVAGGIGVLVYLLWPKRSAEAPTPLEVQRVFFRNQLFHEFVSILNQLRTPVLVVPVIRYSIWGSRPDYEETQLLGADDFSRLEALYRKVSSRNLRYAHATPQEFMEAHYDESRHEIFADLKRLFDEITWLRDQRDNVDWHIE